MNQYFNAIAIPPFSKAREDVLNVQFDALEAAFDLMPSPTALSSITGYLAAGGTANAITVTHPFEDFAYVAGTDIAVRIANTSTTGVTINVTPDDGVALGAKAVLQPDGSALAAGQLRAGAIVKMTYDGTAFRVTGGLWSEPVLAGALATLAAAMLVANVLPTQTGHAGKTLTTDGTTPSWTVYYAIPDPAASSGKLLRSNGTNWVAVDQYPSQTAGKFLGSNGDDPIWADVIDVQDFTVSGTWTKPDNARVVVVEIYGAGGGGGGGGKFNGVGAPPGCGGGGGSYTRCVMDAGDLPADAAVTIGAGGAGGAATTTVSTEGSAGTNGGDSVFGAFARAYGGKGAPASLNANANLDGGNGADVYGATSRTNFTGGLGGFGLDAHGTSGGGGGGGPSGKSAGYPGGNSELGGGGGGGGATAIGGGDPGPGAGGGPPGRIGGLAGVGVAGAGGTGLFRCGGGGGTTVVGGTAGQGGQGGIAGGGGGGGAARTSDALLSSGAGGAGGAGFCRVTTW